MPRRSGRLSTDGGPAAMHKRAASGSTGVASTAKRPKKQQATPTKSQYFKGNGHDDEGLEVEDVSDSPSADETASEFEGDSQAESPEPDEEDEENDSDDATPRGKASSKGARVWKPGTKTGLEPGQQLVIKKPKARPAGKIPYSDDTIHPNTLDFLGDLKANNERSWLKMHDAEFRQAEKDWHSFVEKMTERLTEIDDTVPELPVKDVIFRVYRDIRFSKEKTPYKPWFSAAWSRTGRKSTYAHYYVQIAPNKSFVGGGVWHPEPAPMAAVRTSIDGNPRAIKDVLLDDGIRKEFLGEPKKTDAAVVKAFVKSNSENALKSKPKGYNADHPDIELLRLRNYTVGRSLSDEEVLGMNGTARITALMAALKPFITFLNSVVMPDDNPASSDNDEDEDEDDEDGGEESDGDESSSQSHDAS